MIVIIRVTTQMHSHSNNNVSVNVFNIVSKTIIMKQNVQTKPADFQKKSHFQ